MDLAIQAVGLSRRFGKVVAVDDVDLAVPTACVYGFLGPNGSGKTTTLRLVLGLLRPDRGTVLLFGREVDPDPALYSRIGAIVERPAFYSYISGRDNLRVLARSSVNPRKATSRVEEVLSFAGLADSAGRLVSDYSTGMRQRLALAAALLLDPELLILDEPTNGLDPAGVAEARSLIGTLARAGKTVFLSSHVLTEVERLCSRVAILKRGRLVTEGAMESVLRGEARLSVTLASADAASLASRILAAKSLFVEGGEENGQILVSIADEDAPTVVRILAENHLYPLIVQPWRPSLESVFLKLTTSESGTDQREIVD